MYKVSSKTYQAKRDRHTDMCRHFCDFKAELDPLNPWRQGMKVQTPWAFIKRPPQTPITLNVRPEVAHSLANIRRVRIGKKLSESKERK